MWTAPDGSQYEINLPELEKAIKTGVPALTPAMKHVLVLALKEDERPEAKTLLEKIQRADA